MKNKALKTKILSTEEETLFDIVNTQSFQAKPVNKKILYGDGKMGIPQLALRPLTQFQEFNFHSDNMNQTRKQEQEPEQEQVSQFKARPLKETIFKKPVIYDRELLLIVLESNSKGKESN